jgi:hypothetical protein
LYGDEYGDEAGKRWKDPRTKERRETRLANAEKTQEQKNGERWRNWKIEMVNRRILSRATGFGRGGEFEFAFVARYIE